MTAGTRPGGRTARVRGDVLRATLELVQRDGIAGLTVEAVAERSGVHRTTIHRRWASRAELVADALLEVAAVHVQVPDTGRLRSDLRLLAREVRDAVRTPLARAIVAATSDPSAGSAEGGPPTGSDIADISNRYWQGRFEATAVIVERAVERDELPKGTDPRFVIEAVGGPIWFRSLVVGRPFDDASIDHVIDTVIAGLRKGAP